MCPQFWGPSPINSGPKTDYSRTVLQHTVNYLCARNTGEAGIVLVASVCVCVSLYICVMNKTTVCKLMKLDSNRVCVVVNPVYDCISVTYVLDL